MRFFIENQIAKRVFLERFHLQQNDVANDRVKDLRIIERLIRIIDRLRINSAAVSGVVFDFDCQIAADGFDENTVVD